MSKGKAAVAGEIEGYPYWEVAFDANGTVRFRDVVDAMLNELPAAGLTDLFVFAHGWNNDANEARSRYRQFFAEVRKVLAPDAGLPVRRSAAIGVLGAIWPSKRWADEDLDVPYGAAAGLADAAFDPALVTGLKDIFDTPRQRDALDTLAGLLQLHPADPRALQAFHDALALLGDEPDAADDPEDHAEAALLLPEAADAAGIAAPMPAAVPRPARAEQIQELFDRFGSFSLALTSGGSEAAAGVPDFFTKQWLGAKEVLRAFTYYQMKRRAGPVGAAGLGPLLAQVHAAQPDLNLHLIGHSFGARLVSFAVKAWGATPAYGGTRAARRPSPVTSLFLLQGAFSHYAFADALPHDPARSGALAGLPPLVDGPITVTYTGDDWALSVWYPLASMARRDDASGGVAFDEHLFDRRWLAMGHDGARQVGETPIRMPPMVGRVLDGTTGEKLKLDKPYLAARVFNLDAHDLIKVKRFPMGAHSDIFYPNLAWLLLAFAGILGAH